MSSTNFPKAVLYTFKGSLWGSVPLLTLVEKGYNVTDYEVRQVNLMEGENFAPTYLRVNSKGTVPSLVVPLADTTGQEVDTKFRALSSSIEITQFLDSSRSQLILDIKGDDNGKPAPVLAPATIEGKAVSDSLIALVHSTKADGNSLLLSARNEAELQAQRASFQGLFCKNRQAALEKYRAEAQANAGLGGENPRTAHMTEKLVQWYNDKLTELAPLHQVYLNPSSSNTEAFITLSRQNWNQIATVLSEIESQIEGPFALGDQVSLADMHLIAWLARLFAIVTNLEKEKDELAALDKALRNECLQGNPHAAKGVTPKLKAYWIAAKGRPCFEAVYGSGLH